MLIPWSAFWDRNYFVEAGSAFSEFLTSNYTRGAITGLGLVNVWAALAELADLFGSKTANHGTDNQPSNFSNLQ